MSLAKWSCACLLAMVLCGVAQAQTVEEVEKKLVDAHTRLKSYTAKTKTLQNFEMGEGNKMTSDYDGTIEWMREGDKHLFRTDMKGTTIQAMGGTENKMEVTVLMLSDGDALYTLSTQMGQTMATKQKPDTAMTGDPKKLFEKIHADNTIKILPDDKVEGKATYVLEVTPKSEGASPVAKSLMYFDKETGINVKVVGLNKDGKEVFSTVSTDIKINTEIPKDHFQFKAPEGVQVMDMTGSEP